MIDFACNTCGAVLHVADQLAGKKGKCQKCGAILEVPQQPQRAVSLTFPEKSQAAVPQTANPEPTGSRLSDQSRTLTTPAGLAIRHQPGASTQSDKYPGIVREAKLLRSSALIVKIFASIILLLGVVAPVMTIAAHRMTANIKNDRQREAAQQGLSDPFVAIGAGLTCAFMATAAFGFAGFLRLSSHMSEAVRDMVIHSLKTSSAGSAKANENPVERQSQ